MSEKDKVLKKLPEAYCVRLTKSIEGNKYIVWPGKCQPRGLEQPAIGAGITAALAWADAKKNIGN